MYGKGIKFVSYADKPWFMRVWTLIDILGIMYTGMDSSVILICLVLWRGKNTLCV